MAKKNKQKRLFAGMSYREVQRSNTNRRLTLPKKQKALLKKNGYRNVGWENIIKLYEKLNELEIEDNQSFEELFLEADRIGNKYQTPEERQAFQQALSVEVEAIAKEVDKQFPDTEPEVIDYSR